MSRFTVWHASVLLLAVTAGVTTGGVLANQRIVDSAGARAAASYTPPIVEPSPRAVFLGDSFTEASQVPTGRGFPDLVAQKFHWAAVNAGEGATGYVEKSAVEGNTSFPGRVNGVLDALPDWVFVAGGINDSSGGYSDAQVSSAARATLTPLAQALPKRRVVVVGPFWPNGRPVDAVLRVRDDVRREADRLGLTFLDPIAEHWITDGNRGAMIGPDGTHPTVAGQALIAARIEEDLVRLGLTSG